MVVTKPCDLVVTNIYVTPGNPIVGEAITIKATIKNIGQGISPAGRVHRVGFYINGSTTADFWSDDYNWSIEPGQSVTVTLTGGKSASQWIASLAGTYTIKAVVDDPRHLQKNSKSI